MGTRKRRHRELALARNAGHSALVALAALWVALAVLVHHDATAPASPHSMSSMSSMSTTRGMPASPQPSAHGSAKAVNADDAMSCSGAAAQHCAAASVQTAKYAPPSEALRTAPRTDPGPSGRPAATASVERAPPDLSVLSRLRI
ncbi:DUF6153 family protein [Streptomyces sp. NPDC005263]|uniref:DUF6153 family protein n=1 Tax=Streptomyces sp. NPDC005263 TaxID=3364711 RepID=UPI003686FAEA